jgi:tRNA threonylcarbamoyladenosine biosynthesis protein TsaE
MAKLIFTLETISDAARQFLSQIGEERDVIAFYGAMGAGKTTFIKALCEVLGVTETVNSPTFSIVNEYTDAQGNPVYHFDFYRINNSREAIEMGCNDYFYSGNLCLIEWAEHIAELLPENHLAVYISEQEDGSRVLKSKKNNYLSSIL